MSAGRARSSIASPRPILSRGSMHLLLPLLLAACPWPEEPAPPPGAPGILAAGASWEGLSPLRASELIALSLDCVDRPWPNKPSHVHHGPEDFLPPSETTPAFSGCFDWHSAVHGHWSMVRVLRQHPGLVEAPKLRAALDAHLADELMARELAFFEQERAHGFERPYGWGWFLRLHGELHSWDDPDARRWARATFPLARLLSSRLRAYLQDLTVPVREGTHSNTAYAMIHALDAAEVMGNGVLASAIHERALDFYGRDRDCPTAYEPSGEDFISPCLTEAALMLRVLEPAAFTSWLEAFLPPPEDPRFGPLAIPVQVHKPDDPRIGHLIGLAFQRAGAYREIAAALPADHPRRAIYERLAVEHMQAGFEHLHASGYGGAHWLASFAIYSLTEAGRYDAAP
jgi:hypothetical protein